LVCYLAAVAARSDEGAEIAAEFPAVTSPPGERVTWEELPEAVERLADGKEIDFDGASGPLDLDLRGDPTAATYDIYEFAGDDIELVDQVSLGAQTSEPPGE
jgi:branched-chain amino acid transport system substrate-binding protein